MCPITRDGLEGYLAGKPDPRLQQHLAQCRECRETATQFLAVAEMVRSLRPAELLEPAPGFYGRVMDRIESQRSSSIWSVFLEPLFAKRLVYASVILTLFLGIMLFTSPKDEAVHLSSTPEHILVEEQPPVSLVNVDQDRNTVFVQLTTYQE
ncbi:MAG: hypothetical protein NZV14_10445 [Bryobacteraceae bacterium]|nr:hypothetical protein [Bryobacteraceae bacterium]MDW8378572.1 hypothetical protein [Bryobacterales bacterium]